jgi:coenzyme Q-binding protein COQ10
MRQSVQRVVPHERERIFDLVADVESYPSFLPLWKVARIVGHTADGYRTRQSLGIGPAKLDFISHTTLTFPDRIVVVSRDGPLRSLRMEWALENAGAGLCRAKLDLVVEVHSRMLQKLLQATYGEMAPRLITAFERRADAVARGEIPPPPPFVPIVGTDAAPVPPGEPGKPESAGEGRQ